MCSLTLSFSFSFSFFLSLPPPPCQQHPPHNAAKVRNGADRIVLQRERVHLRAGTQHFDVFDRGDLVALEVDNLERLVETLSRVEGRGGAVSTKQR